ncbi:MAG: hypothetical protein K2J33_02365, partial [Alistipes sp.]|nr:hypothetical protein [Alistipes sp.]
MDGGRLLHLSCRMRLPPPVANIRIIVQNRRRAEKKGSQSTFSASGLRRMRRSCKKRSTAARTDAEVSAIGIFLVYTSTRPRDLTKKRIAG